MPRRDGTGPMSMGKMTGRGLGFCNVAKVASTIGGIGLGLGLGCRRGFRRNAFSNIIDSESQKDLFMEEKAILENRLKVLNKQLNNSEDE